MENVPVVSILELAEGARSDYLAGSQAPRCDHYDVYTGTGVGNQGPQLCIFESSPCSQNATEHVHSEANEITIECFRRVSSGFQGSITK